MDHFPATDCWCRNFFDSLPVTKYSTCNDIFRYLTESVPETDQRNSILYKLPVEGKVGKAPILLHCEPTN